MTQPLKNARIGIDSIARRGVVSAGSAAEGFPASAAANELTATFWKPTALPATWEVQLPDRESVDFIGIAAHDLVSVGANFVLQAWLDEAWENMPVLLGGGGELFTYNGGLLGSRGLSPEDTLGSRRPGRAQDGRDVVDMDGEREARFGTHSLTVEPATTNDLNADTRASEAAGFAAVGAAVLSEVDGLEAGEGALHVEADEDDGVETDAATVTPSSGDVSVSFYFRGDGDYVLEVDDALGVVDDTTFSGDAAEWRRITFTTDAVGDDPGTLAFRILAEDDGSVFEITRPQVERAAAATSFADPTRDDQALEYPVEPINSFRDCTINFWARMPSANAASSRRFLYAGEHDPAQKNAVTVFRGTNNNVVFGTVNDSGATDLLVFNDPAPWDGGWHMVTAVLTWGEAAHHKAIYFDGELVSEADASGAVNLWKAAGFWVGNFGGSNRLGSLALMDDLLVVGRAAGAEEIAEWFEAGAMSLGLAQLPADDRPIMRLLQATESSRFRVRFVGDNVPTVGVIYIGKALEMPRAIYGGHTPITLARQSVLRPNVSERGQLLGRSLVRSGSAGSWTWRNLHPRWYRQYFDAFVELARRYPFFILWRPAKYPEEAGYVWTSDDIHPTNTGQGKGWMEVTVTAAGLGVD